MKEAIVMGWVVAGYENICSGGEYRGMGVRGSREIAENKLVPSLAIPLSGLTSYEEQ